MTQLVPSKSRHAEVAAILERVEREGIMDIDAQKEAQYAKQLVGQRFAIVDERNAVVGYVSGHFSGGRAPGFNVADKDVIAFVGLIVIDADARGCGHAFESIKQFAAMAQHEKAATLIALNLDQNGDVDARRTAFERMGFSFVRAVGAAAIGDLLGNTLDQ